MSDMYIYPMPTTQYCVVGSSQKSVEKEMIQIKDNFQIQNNFRPCSRLASLFHFTPLNTLDQSSFKHEESVAYSCVKNFEPTMSDFETRFTSLF